MTDQQELFTAGGAIEWRDGNTRRQNDRVHHHAPHVQDDRIARALSIRTEMYEPEEWNRPDLAPGQAKDLDEHRQLLRVAGTERFTEAFEHGDMSTLKSFPGDPSQKADVSGIKEMDRLRGLMRGPAPIIYIFAPPGAGKTNFALLLAQLWQERQPDDSLLASNIKTLEETDEWVDDKGRVRDGWLGSYGELTEWLKQDGDVLAGNPRPKLFVWDEVSSAGSGVGEQGYTMRTKMGPLLFKIRKYGGSIIVIGHDPNSVAPLVRELGTIVKKIDVKEAQVFDSIKNGSARNPLGDPIQGIPPTDLTYNDKEPTKWSWEDSRADDIDSSADFEDTMEAVAMYNIVTAREEPEKWDSEEPVAWRKLAGATPWDHSTCKRRYDRYTDDGKYRDEVQQVAEVIA
ncbi:ATP-binding protein [Haloarchaeobius iranensis]|uniref:Uncharacterized protein n=1 Tax=Haloarchaeobius iranensis TaxID=996166 RepID=A0A1G9YDG7_9EURY|nr:ATP-binding protein [Haloarchaeobius iranensis]SDN07169.1 hypothetical protein SAMN05192554_11410 [Haloarchaeobius iranensis]